MSNIPVFRVRPSPDTEIAILECLRSGWWGYGPKCHELEGAFTRCRGGWALATSTCTTALYLAACALRQSDADEVIVPAITFLSTAMAFHAAGFKVRVADVDPNSLMITADTIAPLLNHRTRCIVPVHLYGQRASVSALRAICDKHHLSLVEDCAHRLDLDDAAPVGDFCCYSFNAVKEAPAGEGGLLWGRTTSIEDKIRRISYLGMGVDTFQRATSTSHRDYAFYNDVGLKLRLNDIAATLAILGLKQRAAHRAERQRVFEQYDSTLSRLDRHLSPIRRDHDHSCLMYVVRLHGLNREQFRMDVARHGVSTSTHYPSLSRHPLFAADAHACPVAESADTCIVTLPCFPGLLPQEQRAVIEAVALAVAGRGESNDW